ncbi:MAG: hypothetical protein ACRDTT_06395, partial [Pseudonocardiaceae bacterium]
AGHALTRPEDGCALARLGSSTVRDHLASWGQFWWLSPTIVGARRRHTNWLACINTPGVHIRMWRVVELSQGLSDGNAGLVERGSGISRKVS